jgi:hypothetical protein
MVGVENPPRGTLDAHGNEIEDDQDHRGEEAAGKDNQSGKSGCRHEGVAERHQAGQGRHSQEDQQDPVRQVSASQLRRIAGAELAERTDQILDNPDWGAALYRSDSTKYVVSFGHRFAEIPTKFAPSHYGDAVLSEFVAPEPVQQEMISPVLKALQDRPPQIAALPRQPPKTTYPEFPSGR